MADSQVQTKARLAARAPWYLQRSLYSKRVPTYIEYTDENHWRNYMFMPRRESDKGKDADLLAADDRVFICWITPLNMHAGVRLPKGTDPQPLLLYRTEAIVDLKPADIRPAPLQIYVASTVTGPPRARQVFPDVCVINLQQ